MYLSRNTTTISVVHDIFFDNLASGPHGQDEASILFTHTRSIMSFATSTYLNGTRTSQESLLSQWRRSPWRQNWNKTSFIFDRTTMMSKQKPTKMRYPTKRSCTSGKRREDKYWLYQPNNNQTLPSWSHITHSDQKTTEGTHCSQSRFHEVASGSADNRWYR